MLRLSRSLGFTSRLPTEDFSADSVNLRLPLLDGPVPLPPGVLPGHVGGPGHLLLSLVLGNLSDVGLVVLRPLAVGQLLPPPVEDARVRLQLRLLGLLPGAGPAEESACSRSGYGGTLRALSLSCRHTC